MTNDYCITQLLISDDGRDGVFWRRGERWMREKGREYRLFDVAPKLEAAAQLALSRLEQKAKELSMEEI
jgi:hypothetical protein